MYTVVMETDTPKNSNIYLYSNGLYNRQTHCGAHRDTKVDTKRYEILLESLADTFLPVMYHGF